MSDAAEIGFAALQGLATALPQVTAAVVGDSWTKTAKAMRLQNQLNMENWREANEYNRPANQMARLSEGGLNPNLFYGSGSASNTASNPSGVGLKGFQPYTGYSQIGNFGINKMLEERLQHSTIRLQDSQQSKNEADKNNAIVQNAGYAAEARSKIAKADIDETTKEDLKQQVSNATEISNEKVAQERENSLYLQNQNTLLGKQVEWADKMIEQQFANLVKQGKLTDAQASAQRAQASASIKSVAVMSSQIQLNNQRISQIQYELDSNVDASVKKELNTELFKLESSNKKLAMDIENDYLYAKDLVSPVLGWYNTVIGGLLEPIAGVFSGSGSQIIKTFAK